MENQKPKNQNELLLEKIKNSLETAEIRGGFALDGKITVQTNLLGAPVSLKGRVKVQVIENQFTAAEQGSMECNWNIAGKCLITESPALDLVINLIND